RLALHDALPILMLNVRQPAPDPAGWYMLPSVDVVALFGLLSIFAGLRWVAGERWAVVWNSRALERSAKAVLVLSGAAFVFFRAFRVGDGVTQTFQSRHVNVFVDTTM